MFDALMSYATTEPTKHGGKYGPRSDSKLTAMTQFVKDHPGCTGGEVAEALEVYRQLVHAGLWALEQRGILQSKVKPVPLSKRRANDKGMQKHYWRVT